MPRESAFWYGSPEQERMRGISDAIDVVSRANMLVDGLREMMRDTPIEKLAPLVQEICELTDDALRKLHSFRRDRI